MTALCEDPIPAASSACSRLASVRPPKPAEPAARNWRRETPSQCLIDRSQNFSIVLSSVYGARIFKRISGPSEPLESHVFGSFATSAPIDAFARPVPKCASAESVA